MSGKIITIGLQPCWDITCRGEDLNWGEHVRLKEQTTQPAGKALNVSRALAWMGVKSTAAGLWGRADYLEMLAMLKPLGSMVKPRFTVVPGRTRRNITLHDDVAGREMHLRAQDTLTSRAALRILRCDLKRLVRPRDICVLAGSSPEGPLLDEVLALIRQCRQTAKRMVVDTSGEPLRRLVKGGGLWFIKPNVAELSELVGRRLRNERHILVKAAQTLLTQTVWVLVSRGAKGALLVGRDGVWFAQAKITGFVRTTVGCGDYLLAGMLAEMQTPEADPAAALKTAIQAATARALDRAGNESFNHFRRTVTVTVRTES